MPMCFWLLTRPGLVGMGPKKGGAAPWLARQKRSDAVQSLRRPVENSSWCRIVAGGEREREGGLRGRLSRRSVRASQYAA